MENEIIKGRKNTSLIIWLVILSLLIVGLCGYIVYDKLLSQDNDTVELDINDTVENNNNPSNQETTKNNNDNNQDDKITNPVKTVLICNSEQKKENNHIWSYTIKIEFVNNVFSTYEMIRTYKYENSKDYNNVKKYIDERTAGFDDNNLIIKEYSGHIYELFDGTDELFKDKTIEQVKYQQEAVADIKVVCSIQN